MSDELFLEEQAMQWTDKEARAWLSDLGYDPHMDALQIDWREVSPLHVAARTGHMDMVRWLIDRGSDVRARDCYGNTPLHYAAKAGKSEAVVHLVEHGAKGDVHTPDRKGKTPQQVACEGGFSSISAYLFDQGAANGGLRVFIERWSAARPPLNCLGD